MCACQILSRVWSFGGVGEVCVFVPMFWSRFLKLALNYFHYASVGIHSFVLKPIPTLINSLSYARCVGFLNGSVGAQGASFCSQRFGIVSCRQFSMLTPVGLLSACSQPPTLCNMQGVCEWECGGARMPFCSLLFPVVSFQYGRCGFAIGLFSALPPP